MKVILKIFAVVIFMILSVLGLGVKVTEKIGNKVAGLLYVLIGILVLMALCTQQWLEVGVFSGAALVVFGLQFGAAFVEAVIELLNDLCKCKFMGSNKSASEL